MVNLKRKPSISLVMIIIMLVQLISPFFSKVAFADTPNGSFTINQSIVGNDATINPAIPFDSSDEYGLDNTTTVRIDYASISTNSYFKDVVLTYTLPYGAKLAGLNYSSSLVKNSLELDALPEDTQTITFEIADDFGNNTLNAGVSSYVEVTFKFPLPSPYPNGRVVRLNDAEISGFLANDQPVSAASSEELDINYLLVDGWEVVKDGPVTATITNNTSITELYVDYTISLQNGNIPLKDVEIVDTLPDDAAFVSSSITPFDTSGNTVTWKLDNVPADEPDGSNPTLINARLKFPINIEGASIVDGDKRNNAVTVTGYPVDYDESGNVIKSAEVYKLGPWSDDIETEFEQSTAAWGVHTDWNSTVTISKDPTVQEVQVNYKVELKDGDTDLNNVDLIYELPLDARVVSVSDSPVEYEDEFIHTLTWAYPNVSALSTKSENVTVAYAVYRDYTGIGVKNGDIRTNTVTVEGEEGVIFSPTSDTATTTFIDSDEEWYVEKDGPSNDEIIIKNDESTEIEVPYKIMLKSTGSGNYNEQISEITITDKLPPFATYVDGSATVAGAVHNPSVSGPDGDNRIILTWVLNDISGTDSLANRRIEYKVKLPIDRDSSGDGIKPGDTVVNDVSVEGYPVDEYGNKSTEKLTFTSGTDVDSDKKTVAVVEQNSPSPQITVDMYNQSGSKFSKNTEDEIQNKNFNRDEYVEFRLDFTNDDENILRNSVLVNENLHSDKIDYTEIRLGQSSQSLAYAFWYETNNDGIWIKQGDYNTDTEQTIDVSSLNITGIELEFTDDIPVNFSYDIQKIRLIGKTKASLTADISDISNSATLDYEYRQFDNSFASGTQLMDKVVFDILVDKAWVSALEKNKLTGSASYAHKAGQTINFELKVTNHSTLGTSVLEKPILVDIVPMGFKYLDNWEDYWDIDNPDIDKPDRVIKHPNYPNDGETTVVWYWDDYDLPLGKSISLRYDLEVLSYAQVGWHTNTFYLLSDEAYAGISSQIETEDLDNDGDTSSYYSKAPDCNINVDETSALISKKWVKGELDDYYDEDDNEENNYTYYNSSGFNRGRTTPGGSVDYKLEITNGGNVYIKDMEIVDILPYEGDTSVLDPSVSRDSTWTPYLISPIEFDEDTVVSHVYKVGETGADITVEYSTAEDPIRQKDNSTTIGTQEPNWSEIPPEDLTGVRSLRFKIKDFETANSEGEYGLEPGSTVTLKWKMRAPLGAPTGPLEGNTEVAWNSISNSGTDLRIGDVENSITPAEPNKVGIQVETNPFGEIGDFVWFDKNRDGVQNDGYDQEAAGINGITVNLYRENVGSWDLVDTTLTGNDDEGNPGYYLFPALETDDYFVSFEIPDYYTVTNAVYGDAYKNSDGYYDAILDTIRTDVVEIRVDQEDKRIRHDIDLGLVDSGSVPSIDLKKEVVGYRKTDGIEVDFPIGTKQPVNKGETILYKISVENNGEVPLNNIRLEDLMTYPDFKFASAKFTDASSNEVFYDSLEKDPNITAAEGIDDVIHIDNLKALEKYEFDAEYLVSSEDITTSPIINTVNVWANELKDKEDPLNPPAKTVTEAVYTADMSLTKTSDVDITEGVEAGQDINYTMTVTNNGSVDLYGVKVIDDNIDSFINIDTNDKLTLMTESGVDKVVIDVVYKGQSVDVQGSYRVKEGDISGKISNTAKAEHDDIRYDVEATHDVNTEKLLVQKVADKSVVGVGDKINYNVTLTNNSTKDLSNVKIVKDQLVSSSNNGASQVLMSDNIISSLLKDKNAPANQKSVSVEIGYDVTLSDIDELNGTKTVVNTVYAISDDTIEEVVDSASVDIAHIKLEKKEVSTGPYAVGDTIEYDIAVTNIGSIDLSDITVKDRLFNQNGGNDFTTIESYTIGNLLKKQSDIHRVTYKLTEEDIINLNSNKLKNKAIVHVQEINKDFEAVVDVDTVGVKLDKTVYEGEYDSDIDGSEAVYGPNGTDITYLFKITNVGSTYLDITDLDDTPLAIGLSDLKHGNDYISNIPPGQSVSYYYETKIDGNLYNVATVKANPTHADGDDIVTKPEGFRVTDVDDANVYIYKLVIDKAVNESEIAVNNTVTYTIAVKNEGEDDLHNVTIIDDMLNINENIGTLTVADSVYEISKAYKVTQKDVDESLNNILINTAKAYSDETAEVQATKDVKIITDPKLTIKKTGPQGTVTIGQQVEYDFILVNEGDIELHDVYLEDEIIGFSTYVGDLTVGQAVYESVYHIIEEKDAPVFKNIAKATSKETGEVESNPWSVNVQINPNLSFIKTGPTGPVKVGEEIQYLLTVENVGDTVLESVYVEDSMLDFSDIIDNLNVGDSVELKPDKYTVTEEDYWRELITNTAQAHFTVSETVYGSVYESETVYSTWTIPTIDADFDFDIVKSVDKESAKVGDTLTYTIKVTNTGDVALNDVHVVDDIVGLDEIITLDVNKTKTFTEIYTITQADKYKEKVVNTVTAEYGDMSRSSTVETKVIKENLNIVKTVDKEIAQLGQTINYTITVTNEGNVKLNNVHVEDYMLGLNEIITLNVGGERTFTGTHIITMDDETAGEIINTATATSGDITVNDDIETKVIKEGLNIIKSVDKSSARVGDTLSYTIKVINNGNVDLNDVQVKDAMIELEETIASLGVNEIKEYTGTYIVAETDEAVGKIINTATATSDNITVSDDVETKVKKDNSSSGGGSGGSGDDNQPVGPQPEPELDQPQEPVEPVNPEQPQEPEAPTEEQTDNPLGEVDIEDDGTAVYTPPENSEIIDIVEEPANGTVEIDENGNIKYTPKEGYNGSDKFKIKIKDADGNELIIEVDISEDDIAQGTINVLPQTGEARPYPYYLFGLALVLLGLYLNLENLLNKIKH